MASTNGGVYWLTGVIFVVVGVLAALDKPLEQVVSLIVIVIPMIYSVKRVDEINARTKDISDNVNGKLTDRLDGVHKHISHATGTPKPVDENDSV